MRGHRTLVFLDDYGPDERWGWWCVDCTEGRDGFKSDIRPGRLATRHEKDTKPALQEAS